MSERVQKILAQWGVASRRQAEKMILEQRVKLNGKIIDLGAKADPNKDILEVDGYTLQPSERPPLVYLLLNKPLGVVCTCDDPRQRTTVLDLLPPNLRTHQGIHPVGRLDINSTGALLLTNDGDFTLKLTHPRYLCSKTYRVWLKGNPTEEVLQTWAKGVWLEDKKTLPAQVKLLKTTKQATLIEIKLREGRNRQIRRVAEQLGFPVAQLHRLSIGSILLTHPVKLNPGEYRQLTPEEVKDLLYQKCYNH